MKIHVYKPRNMVRIQWLTLQSKQDMNWDKTVGRKAGGMGLGVVIEVVPEDALGLECYDSKTLWIHYSCWSVHFRSWILHIISWILILKMGQDSTEKHGRSCSRLVGSPFKVERRMPLDFRLGADLTGCSQGGSCIENKYSGPSR